MDINVNTSAFEAASNKLKSHCRNINYVSKALLHNLRLAHQDFNDINYDRTEDVIYDVLDSIEYFYREVEAIEKGLKKLSHCVEDYNNTGYRG